MSSLIGKLFHFRHKPGFTDLKKKKKKKTKKPKTDNETDGFIDKDFEIQEDPLTRKEKEAMKKLIIEKRARLSLKTMGILKSI